MTPNEYQEKLNNCGGLQETLSQRERWLRLQQWREVYAAGLYAAKGLWKLGRFEWHVFSFGYARALRGARAMEVYNSEHPPNFFVCPEKESLPALRINGGELPDFHLEHDDVFVWPEDLHWTMAFTHDDLGPFFCRKEWLEYGGNDLKEKTKNQQ